MPNKGPVSVLVFIVSQLDLKCSSPYSVFVSLRVWLSMSVKLSNICVTFRRLTNQLMGQLPVSVYKSANQVSNGFKGSQPQFGNYS